MMMRRWSVAAVWMMTPVWLLLGVAGNAIADWDPIEDATASFTGNQYYGGQIALAEIRFLPSGSQVAELTLLIAATDGGDVVRLYSFDTATDTLDLEDEIEVSVSGIDDPIAWTPTFMSLDAVGSGAEPCLVIPTYCDVDSEVGGSISIVRLTERDQSDELIVLDDCLSCTLGTQWGVYHVAELPSGAEEDYSISTEFGEYPPPDIDENVIVFASYNSDSTRFEAQSYFQIPDFYYGARHSSIWARAWLTYSQYFRYGSEFADTLCYTTTHNGGVLVWDPDDSATERIISRVAASQHGGWCYDAFTGGELGDVHRAAVLEGASSSFAPLGSIVVASRLLFLSNNTMGFVICDVSKPDAPQYVWQWDCDTRPCEEDLGEKDWAWHGAGDNLDDTIAQASPGSLPGETFGIGVASNSSDDPPTIHVYLAGGVDGLRLFDLSTFIDPFGEGESGDDSNYDDFSILCYDDYEIGINDMRAYDLQTFSEDGDTYVFTSWKASRDDEQGPIGLTVHLDEDVICD
jgi:hypothetical protein